MQCFSNLDENKGAETSLSSNSLRGIKCLLDFLVLLLCQSPSSSKDLLPNVFYKLCSLLYKLRLGDLPAYPLLNSAILLTCCLDFCEAKSGATASHFLTSCDRLLELIFRSRSKDICINGGWLGEELRRLTLQDRVSSSARFAPTPVVSRG
jgi:hypothetical protein